MILIFGDTVEATLAFDRHMPPEVNRIALVERVGHNIIN